MTLVCDSLGSEGQLEEPFQMHWEREERQQSIDAASDLFCIAEVRPIPTSVMALAQVGEDLATSSGHGKGLAESKE